MNILSIDLEDYFMVSAFEGTVTREDWNSLPSRIERNTHRILDLLDGHRSTGKALRKKSHPSSEPGETQQAHKATFFCLGWIAERFPHLIREIHSRGHEIASHGYDHKMIIQMSGPEEFREDLRRSRATLEDIVGDSVMGYRAPSYSITYKTLWALRVLLEEGFLYDSSIFPIQHDRYGIPNAPRFPFLVTLTKNRDLPLKHAQNGPAGFQTALQEHGCSLAEAGAPACGLGFVSHSSSSTGGGLDTSDGAPQSFGRIGPGTLLEVPLSTVRFMGRNLPVAGGGYFRLLPLGITLWALRKTIRRFGQPFVFYIHPWELDPEQPRVKGLPLLSRIRHYLNLEKTEVRMKTLLLQGGGFTSFRSLYLPARLPAARRI